MQADYKLSYVNDTGVQKTALMRFYTGDTTTEPEWNVKKHAFEDVTRYRRTAMIGEKPATYTPAKTVPGIETDARAELRKLTDAKIVNAV